MCLGTKTPYNIPNEANEMKRKEKFKLPDEKKDHIKLIENLKRDLDEMDDLKIRRVVQLVKTLKKVK